MSDVNADECKAVLADIILNAVLHPELQPLELVPRDVLDRARAMLDDGDIAAAAMRARQPSTPPEEMEDDD